MGQMLEDVTVHVWAIASADKAWQVIYVYGARELGKTAAHALYWALLAPLLLASLSRICVPHALENSTSGVMLKDTRFSRGVGTDDGDSIPPKRART